MRDLGLAVRALEEVQPVRGSFVRNILPVVSSRDLISCPVLQSIIAEVSQLFEGRAEAIKAASHWREAVPDPE